MRDAGRALCPPLDASEQAVDARTIPLYLVVTSVEDI
jgi:hypothetical protein